MKKAFRKIIEKNMNGLQNLKFKDTEESYKLAEDNIYKSIKKHLKYRK